jgi:hypothetical protein
MNSNKATMPTMMFSIGYPSHFLAETDIQARYCEEQHHDRDIDKVCHIRFQSFLLTGKGAPIPGRAIIKRRAADVKISSTARGEEIFETVGG